MFVRRVSAIGFLGPFQVDVPSSLTTYHHRFDHAPAKPMTKVRQGASAKVRGPQDLGDAARAQRFRSGMVVSTFDHAAFGGRAVGCAAACSGMDATVGPIRRYWAERWDALSASKGIFRAPTLDGAVFRAWIWL
jgi:hypothetical protein